MSNESLSVSYTGKKTDPSVRKGPDARYDDDSVMRHIHAQCTHNSGRQHDGCHVTSKDVTLDTLFSRR